MPQTKHFTLLIFLWHDCPNDKIETFGEFALQSKYQTIEVNVFSKCEVMPGCVN